MNYSKLNKTKMKTFNFKSLKFYLKNQSTKINNKVSTSKIQLIQHKEQVGFIGQSLLRDFNILKIMLTKIIYQ
jgi:hypothetical protein